MDLDKIFIKKFVNKETTTPFTMKFWDGEEVKIGDGSSKFKVNLYEPLNKKEQKTLEENSKKTENHVYSSNNTIDGATTPLPQDNHYENWSY